MVNTQQAIKVDSAIRNDAHRRQVIVAAARKIVANSTVTECAMEPGLGFRGRVCPVVNCYMRCPDKGACLATQEARASSKAMRDTVAVVDVIEAARNAPDWVSEKTYPAHSLDAVSHSDFMREAGITAAQLQYVMDTNQIHAATLASLFRD